MRDDDRRGIDPRDDYLWDGRGAPDAEVQRLERLLGRLRYDPRATLDRTRLPSPIGAGAADPEARRAAHPRRLPIRILPLAAAALVLAALGAALVARGRASSAWVVERVAGSVERVRDGATGTGDGGALARGEIVATDADAAALIRMGDIGRVELGPSTRVRLERSSPIGHRMELLEGEISAVTVAPPRLFVVETGAARAVDLGCAYTMVADASGAGVLHVTLGLVAVDLGGRTSFVPAGMMTAMRPGRPAGTPYADDAAPAVREAIALLDSVPLDASTAGPRRSALERVLASARPKDVPTLWHLLPRTERAERERVLRRLLELTPIPDGVSAKDVLRGDARALTRWGADLGLVDSPWWRLLRFTRVFAP